MTYGQLFMRMNPNVKVVENGTCVWIFFDEVNHDTMRKGWWDKEIPDDANDAGWISVKDRCPDLESDYLVTDGHKIQWICRMVKLAGVKAWVNNALHPPVKYWMPLPELPKEET